MRTGVDIAERSGRGGSLRQDIGIAAGNVRGRCESLPVTDRVLGRIGHLVVRLAASAEDVTAAQRLRHRVFVGQRDCDGLECDRLDGFCDHLLAIDTRTDDVIGTYRLLTQERAEAHGGFYSDGEFEIDALVRRQPHRKFLELGRSCTLPDYRDRRTIELLWQGIWAYALRAGTDVMFGCASFPGTNPAAHAAALGYLASNHMVPTEWGAGSRGGAALASFAEARFASAREALRGLPPLVKGYLRLGGRVAPEFFVDHAFDCTDVLIVLPHEAISSRYLAHYGADASRFAA